MADSGDKTEKATPERRRKAREKGDFPKARDAGGVVAALAVLVALLTMGPSAVADLGAFAQHCFREPFDLVERDPSAALSRMLSVVGELALPSAVCASIAALSVGFVQAGFHPRMDLIALNPSRLNPMGKIKSLFAPSQALVTLVQSLVRVGAIGYVVYSILKDSLPLISHLARADLLGSVGAVGKALAELVVKATGALAVLTACDYLWSKYSWERDNMMSRQEVKDEHRQMEGDPRVKGQRARARARMKKGLAKQVRGADVIVVNPTHISVALRYRVKEGAPMLMAKGYDEVALHIRELAREANIPIIENRPLARAIAAQGKVGKPIPVDLYAAVAEVLAFVYRLKGRKAFG
jgi:flagellar biosynthetic protein FlhB